MSFIRTLIGTCIKHKQQYSYLLIQLCRREVIGRYRGSFMGVLWSFFAPLLMLFIYTFVFSVVFKARWNIEQAGTADFAINLFVGILLHSLLAECLNRSTSLIQENVNYIKRVVFPLPLIPLSIVGASTFHFAVGLSVLMVACLIFYGGIPVTALLLPFLLLPFLFFISGLAFFLSAIGVYIRDTVQVMPMVSTVLLFMAPVFYPMDVLPEDMRAWLYLNPLTYPLIESRNVLLYGGIPDWFQWSMYLCASVVSLFMGYWVFRRLRVGFADVV